jgi:hypothetical protein
MSEANGFGASREQFATVLAFLDGAEAAALSHAELETRLQVEGRELFRLLFQDHLDLRASREQRVTVLGPDGVSRSRAETAHTRVLVTVFGQVTVTRIAYRAPGQPNLHPADGLLNLPRERHSHGLRRFAVVEATRGSFDDVVDAVNRATGQQVGKRQVEALAARAAVDVDAFYTVRKPPPGADDAVLVISCDGKGVVMRPDALRKATAAAAAVANPKLATRLSKGEKRNRKRMAEVGTVYDATPAARSPADILPTTEHERTNTSPGPVTRNKWLVASVVDDATSVVAQIFAEADRRDPCRDRTWIALVDGNNHQIHRSPPRPAPATSRSPSSSTSSTSWSTYGKQRGPSTTKGTQQPRRGCRTRPGRSWTAKPPASPARSAARPPKPASTRPNVPAPISARAT